MIERLLRRLMRADSLGILFSVLALLIFTNGISASLQNTETSSFYWVGLAAAMISFGLGKTRLSRIQASMGMAALGVLFVWILGARLTPFLLDLLKAAFSTLPQIAQAIRFGTPVDSTAIFEAWAGIVQASSALMTRLQVWMFTFPRNVATNDALIQSLIWMLILSLCAAWMGWFAEKRNAVTSLLPMLVLLSVVTSYSEYRIDSLWMLVMVLLLLMGIWNYRNHTVQWLKQHVDYSDSIRMDNSQAVIFLTIVVGAFAFATPSISWRDIVNDLRARGERNEAAEMLGIKEPEEAQSNVQGSSMPRAHLLSGGYANSEEIVMTIRTGELPPIPSQSVPVNAPRYYWRSMVYDQYVGSGWGTSTVFKQTIPPNMLLIPGVLSDYRLVHIDVEMAESEGRLFWSGLLFSADTTFTANWRAKPSSDLFADQQALLMADMFAAATRADAYQVETYVPIPTITALRSASMVYPEEIRLKYLALPSSIPERVHDLAHEITGELTNPYDKVKAIESYLRTNYPYTLDVPPPPEGRDAADYFLFELKQGYCDYYATAMVVLARSSGIPARFVSGYAPGSYDAPNAQYVIRVLNAHSWVEVYFPEIGWIEFEPTASLPEIERVEGLASVPSNQADEEIASKLLARFRLERILIWIAPALAILAGVVLYTLFIERWLVLKLAPATAIDTIYQRFYRAGRPVAGAWTQAETSSEFLHKFLDNINGINQLGRFDNLTADINMNAVKLTDLYHSSLFTNHQVRKHDAVIAWQILKRLQPQLFIVRLLHRITRNFSYRSK